MATFRIDNKANIEIDNAQLAKLIGEAELPDKRLIFVFNNAPLPDGNQATFVPRDLLHFSRPYVPVCGGGGLDNWDVCIAISEKCCSLQSQYPAYFIYLIGHELGHAKIFFMNMDLHVHCCLIQKHIKIASNYEITTWIELPHERIFDQFGIYLAEKLYSRDQLNKEIEGLLDIWKCNDRNRLHIMLSLDSSNNLDHLRDELVEISRPYRSALISSWQRHRDPLGNDSLENWFDDYNALFQ